MTAEIQVKIDAVKAPFQTVIEAADAIPALVDAAEKAAYDKGFAEGNVAGIAAGKDMIVLPAEGTGELVYTQEQLAEAVSNGKVQQAAEDQLVIDDLKKQLEAAQAALVGKDEEKAQALAVLRADMIAKVQNFEANEDQSMKDLLAAL